MIASKGWFSDDGDKFMLLEIPNIMVEIRSEPYVTIKRSHIEWFKNEEGEEDRRKVIDKIEKPGISFWSAVIKETSKLEEIEKSRKS